MRGGFLSLLGIIYRWWGTIILQKYYLSYFLHIYQYPLISINLALQHIYIPIYLSTLSLKLPLFNVLSLYSKISIVPHNFLTKWATYITSSTTLKNPLNNFSNYVADLTCEHNLANNYIIELRLYNKKPKTCAKPIYPVKNWPRYILFSLGLGRIFVLKLLSQK